jgi:DNA-binding MarR family transcriptional regulator
VTDETAGDLGILLAMAFRAMTDKVDKGLTAHGYGDLRPAHGFTFQYLASTGGATAVELGAHLGVTKQAAVQLVDELERLGYVRRERHAHDKRARTVTLTDAGWACIQAAGALWRADERHWAGLIGAQRLADLRAGLIAYVNDAGPTPLKPVW